MIVDSNVIIYAIQPNRDALLQYLLDRIDAIHVSAITKLEVVGFHRLNDVEKDQFETFFDLIKVVDISAAVISTAIRLRQQRRRSLGDSIIAATALLYNLPVLTHNVADFSTVDGLQIISLAEVMNA
ncbi:type II toxin-antitoxin system VapC family toxin [Spirosoma sp. KUDC1026]|uniref:type II toxin-antitoxin system VapC family toxin n=1 Tax=Spirosoma sp. KUDC1026 TaxID=2745947 RepID=UPI00159BEA63|nr:type II toxin-antitoxin system VapC family toxin [Spirosoma sp. KUDC1026]QKZ14291.1 type II toxin-antitoxin system VapC family toxin [Spirosoma sp. KUDC1026]